MGAVNAELKAKWVEALRSGKYRQGREQLRDHDTYCCLGVLADVRGYKWPERDVDVPGNNDYCPEQVADALSETEATELALMNDEGQSFAEIADYIEQNL